jgi:hypothetical protein
MISSSKQQVKSLLQPASPSLLPILLLLAVTIGSLSIVSSIVTVGAIIFNSSQKVPSYVMDADGNRYPIRLKPASANAKHARQYASRKVYEIFDWRGVLPPSPDKPEELTIPKRDPGVPIKIGENTTRSITSSTWKAALAFEDPFASGFIPQLAKLTPSEVFQGKAQGVFSPMATDIPENLGQGKWRVRVVGVLMLFENGDNKPYQTPIKYDVFLREVDSFDVEAGSRTPKILAKADKVLKDLPKVLQEQVTVSELAKAIYESRDEFTVITMREVR